MTGGISLRVQCPLCGEWAQLFLDRPTRVAVDEHHKPEVVMLACPHQNQPGHGRPTEHVLNELIPDWLPGSGASTLIEGTRTGPM